jgi:hypothetical protein
MKFYHFSNRKLGKFKEPTDLGLSYKPSDVLWLSNEKDWLEFASEMDIKLKYKYTIEVNPSKLFKLKTYTDIKNFNKKYGINFEYEHKGNKYNNLLIDWNKVRKDHPVGIWIQNANIKKARDEFNWYYSMDVESIIVWKNEFNIISVETLK